MKKTFTLAAMTIALAVCAVALISPDAFAAGVSIHAPYGVDHGMLATIAANVGVGLAGMRIERGALAEKIKAKMAEIKADTAADDAKRIEGEHDALVRDLESLDGKIVETEKREADEAEAKRKADAEADAARSKPSDADAIARAVADAQRAERDRVNSIGDLGRKFGQTDFANEAIRNGRSLQDFRNALIDKLEANPANQGGGVGGVRVEVLGQDAEEKKGRAMEVALLHRFDPVKFRKDFDETPQAREFRGMSIIEMARDALEGRGIRTRGMSRPEIADAAFSMRSRVNDVVIRAGGSLSTSDFPSILANVANKTLRMGYEATPQTFRPLVRVTTVPDFKPVSRVQLGSAPQLEKVNEHGEFKRGKMGDGAETYAISTYGKVVAITRQVIINDDLNAFTRIPRAFGVQAANLESDIVWSQILLNANMGDGNALFSAAHSNLGTAGVIAVAAVGAGRQAMATQKDLDGVTLIAVDARFLVVPKALETTAEQFRGQLYPTATSGVVPDSLRSLGIIAEPRLDNGVTINGVTAAGSASNWYMAGDVNQIDIIELAYLEGQEGLYTETRMGFDVDGMEVKVRQDVGAKAIDWRGLWKNPN